MAEPGRKLLEFVPCRELDTVVELGDLQGFTAFSACANTENIIGVLREFK